MAEKQRRDDAWREEGDGGGANPFARAQTRRDRKAISVLGPAGSGKTTAVQQGIDWAHLAGARILIVAPTGRLAATLRAKYPHLDVDTIHGAFLLYKNLQDTLDLMWPYDLVIVEEVGQLSRWVYERIMYLWEAAERLPCLVFVGDFWQLPGVEPSKASDSPMWNNGSCMAKKQLHTMHRCKCKALGRKLQILRTAKPSVRQL